MEITIKGSEKELAALICDVTEQQGKVAHLDKNQIAGAITQHLATHGNDEVSQAIQKVK